jgi:hypothetical protein
MPRAPELTCFWQLALIHPDGGGSTRHDLRRYGKGVVAGRRRPLFVASAGHEWCESANVLSEFGQSLTAE